MKTEAEIEFASQKIADKYFPIPDSVTGTDGHLVRIKVMQNNLNLASDIQSLFKQSDK